MDADISPVFKSKRSKKKTTLVGLELDPGHLAAAEVTVNGSVRVERGAVALLRQGILRDGDVADAPALAQAIKALFDEHELPRRVRLGIANQRIVVRTLDLPPLDDPKALASAIKVEAPDHIPMPMNEAILDYQPLGLVTNAMGEPRMRVVVVAVRRELVDRLVGAVHEAGLDIEGIDLSAFAMVRALTGGSDHAADERATLYVNVAGLTNVAVANASGCLFTRSAAGGLDPMIHTLAERCGLTDEHARQWMGHVGLATPLDDVEGETELVAATRQVLEDGVHQLADTVRNSLNFYRTQQGSEGVARAVVTGPVIAIDGVTERLGEHLRMPVESAVVAVPESAGDPGRLTVAAGLAVEED